VETTPENGVRQEKKEKIFARRIFLGTGDGGRLPEFGQGFRHRRYRL